MNKMIASSMIVGMVLLSSFTQILLKTSANQKYDQAYKELINWRVLFSYAVYFGVTFVNLFLYPYVQMNSIMVMESLGYVFVPVLSVFLLKEKLTKKQFVGLVLIVSGVFLYACV